MCKKRRKPKEKRGSIVETDIIVIGAGIAGASVAAQLSAIQSITILDMDVAVVVEQIAEFLDQEPVKVECSWAGLRTFAPAHVYVVGFAPDTTGFFWLAGQGGYGIQTAPASAALAASLVFDASVFPTF